MKNAEFFTVRSGLYYIGDPCYVFGEQWESMLKKANNFKRMFYDLCGAEIVVISVGGDGTFIDNRKREYGVDSGLMGFIPVFMLPFFVSEKINYIVEEYAHLQYVGRDSEIGIENEILHFGKLKIYKK
jgi:NAD kinase